MFCTEDCLDNANAMIGKVSFLQTLYFGTLMQICSFRPKRNKLKGLKLRRKGTWVLINSENIRFLGHCTLHFFIFLARTTLRIQIGEIFYTFHQFL